MLHNVPWIGGETGIVIGIDGCRWWAENGLIKYETVDNRYGVVSRRDTLERLRALNELYGRRALDKGFHTADEVDSAQRYISKMVELCKKAKDQGTPDNPDAVRDQVRRYPTTVRISTPLNSF